jgi:hypothetical protein
MIILYTLSYAYDYILLAEHSGLISQDLSSLFPEYLLWFESQFPSRYATFCKEHPNAEAHDLAMLMLKYVQGRVDASLQWKHAIEEVLINELGLVPNRADSCVYCGRIQVKLIFISRATDDFLVGTTYKGY